MVPLLGVALGGVLLAASRTVTRDMLKLQEWMRSVCR